MSGTESDILRNVPDLGGEEDVGGETGGGDVGGDRGSSNDGRTSAQPDQGGQQQPQQQQPVRRRHDGLVEVPNAENPNTRDLVDPVSGKVVATGGIERRIFEDSQRTMRENNQLKQQVAGMSNAMRQSNEVIQEAARLGVQPQDQLVAVRVMADFMRDPVRTLQTLVEEVKAKGYPIPFLEQGVTQGMDMAAMSRMIDGKLQPMMQERAQNLQMQQARQQAQQDLNNFIGGNPEAQNNLDVLAEMLQAQPGLPLHDAWVKMIRWSHENGLDWTQPLKPQIAALQGQQQPTPQQQQFDNRPLPGRRSVNTQQVQRVNGSGATHSENTSWSDIIRDAMRESGMQLN
jgi:hypothetical protein